MSHNVWVKSGRTYNLTPEGVPATATGIQTTIFKDSPYSTFQMYGATTSGVGTATVLIQGSNIDSANMYITIGTISLTLGTTVTADGFTTTAPWKYVRANITALTGTGANVTVLMGV
jgi:hypothetical protein